MIFKMQNNQQLNENLEGGDLKRLVHHELHIDEYKSKMGNDDEICVISFKVSGKEPSADLVAFIEKGYDWVLDADVSSGEKEGGDYLVFVEVARSPELPKQIMEIINDLLNLTEQSLEEWYFKYHKNPDKHELSEENFAKLVPLTPEAYAKKYNQEDAGQQDLDKLKAVSGVEVTTKAPKNEYTESLRIAAGIL